MTSVFNLQEPVLVQAGRTLQQGERIVWTSESYRPGFGPFLAAAALIISLVVLAAVIGPFALAIVLPAIMLFVVWRLLSAVRWIIGTCVVTNKRIVIFGPSNYGDMSARQSYDLSEFHPPTAFGYPFLKNYGTLHFARILPWQASWRDAFRRWLIPMDIRSIKLLDVRNPDTIARKIQDAMIDASRTTI